MRKAQAVFLGKLVWLEKLNPKVFQFGFVDEYCNEDLAAIQFYDIDISEVECGLETDRTVPG